MSAGAAMTAVRRNEARARARANTGEIDLVVQLAHDIRSPLSGILMLAESLREGMGGPVNASQRRQLDLIHGAALSLCTSASDVVALARDGRDLADEAMEEFSLSGVVQAVRDMASPLAAGKHLELRVTHPAHDRRRGCPRALTRVLLNLVTNALKCTEHGVVEIAAGEVDGDPDVIEFAVLDSGPGMRPAAVRADAQPRCGSPEAQRTFMTSSGMGLVICRKLLERMDSTLQFETSVHGGTRFFFEVLVPRV